MHRAINLPRARPVLRSNILARTFHASTFKREHFLNASADKFEERVISKSADKPILVDFFAEWCPPCKQLSPLLEKITSDPSLVEGKDIDLMTINTDEETDLAIKYKISSLPTVIAFKNGSPVAQFVGSVPLPSLQAFCKQL
ncbi:hypothetical protein BOTBODRAFT_38941 [Botryobasidium botryosum FD-172 SS1]|uniref:Thioredoxin domain-containing protein n=1 Tax=Botryobasidium botryosum (strain FD-172 SS1) TaxID=930990 RepID=A0A067LY06_BOTB1|nr:hypothetical protein BOTBODRAFT_38941 [Botryobasidium botryosum FD-172 SS1]